MVIGINQRHLDRDHTGVSSTHSKGTSGLDQFQALCGAAVGPPEEAAASDLAVICLEPGLLLPFPLQAAGSQQPHLSSAAWTAAPENASVTVPGGMDDWSVIFDKCLC